MKLKNKTIFITRGLSGIGKACALAFGKLDIALNNAGIGGEAYIFGAMSETSWLKVIRVNLNGYSIA